MSEWTLTETDARSRKLPAAPRAAGQCDRAVRSGVNRRGRALRV